MRLVIQRGDLMQLNLFSVYDTEQAKDTKSFIYEKLKHYGIDDYCKKHISGKCMLLSEIHERLSSLPKYEEYLIKLIGELSNVVPTLMRSEGRNAEYSHLIEGEGVHQRYYCHYINRGSSVGCEATVFCLELIDDDFFKN